MGDIASIIVLGLIFFNGQAFCMVIPRNPSITVGVSGSALKCSKVGPDWSLCYRSRDVSYANYYIHQYLFPGEHYPGSVKLITRDLQTLADDTLDPLSGMGFGKRKRSPEKKKGIGSPLDPMGGFGFGKRENARYYWFGNYGRKRGDTLDPLAGFGFGKRSERTLGSNSVATQTDEPLRFHSADPQSSSTAEFKLYRIVPTTSQRSRSSRRRRKRHQQPPRFDESLHPGFQRSRGGEANLVLLHEPINLKELEMLLP